MVKDTQIIRRLLLANCLSVFDDFVRLALKGLIFLWYQNEEKKNGKWSCIMVMFRGVFRTCQISKMVNLRKYLTTEIRDLFSKNTPS